MSNNSINLRHHEQGAIICLSEALTYFFIDNILLHFIKLIVSGNLLFMYEVFNITVTKNVYNRR